MHAFFLVFLLCIAVLADNTTLVVRCLREPQPKRWVPAWISCGQTLAYFSPVIPAFMVLTRKIYMRDAGDHDTLTVFKYGALGAAASSLLYTVAYLPDCACRICEAGSETGECAGC